MAFNPNSLIRPGEQRSAEVHERNRRRKALRHPLVLTRQQFKQGLQRSGQTAGQNFRDAARRRLTAKQPGLSGEGLESAIQAAVQARRQQRAAISSSDLSPALQALAKRRLQARDVNEIRRDTNSPYGQIRVRTRQEIMHPNANSNARGRLHGRARAQEVHVRNAARKAAKLAAQPNRGRRVQRVGQGQVPGPRYPLQAANGVRRRPNRYVRGRHARTDTLVR